MRCFFYPGNEENLSLYQSCLFLVKELKLEIKTPEEDVPTPHRRENEIDVEVDQDAGTRSSF